MNNNPITGPFKQFTTNTYVSSTQDFLKSESLLAKLAFLLLVLFIFIILLTLGISFIGWLYGPQHTVKLINGMIDAKQLVVIPQDPTVSGANTISRSSNENKGIEFTWSVWIFINDLVYNEGKYKCVFYKGNDSIADTGLNFPNNSPGLYIHPTKNELVVIMNTFDVINEQIKIPDIPMNKWVNVVIRCENTTLDTYINGTIARSYKLHGVPKQNYGDVYASMNGGFSGYTSNLWYFSRALSALEIQKLAQNGPTLKVAPSTSLTQTYPGYLSMRWYFSGNTDQYNP